MLGDAVRMEFDSGHEWNCHLVKLVNAGGEHWGGLGLPAGSQQAGRKSGGSSPSAPNHPSPS